VCFEKGKKLRVPERVPFRLTRIVRTAFGPVGVDGVFKAMSEFTLDAMRKDADVFSLLLQMFIDSPLAEWKTNRLESRYMRTKNKERVPTFFFFFFLEHVKGTPTSRASPKHAVVLLALRQEPRRD